MQTIFLALLIHRAMLSFCHHLASIVCYLFTFQPPLILLDQLELNFAGMMFIRSSIKNSSFDWTKTWFPQAIHVFIPPAKT
jgi:hypothetical protein